MARRDCLDLTIGDWQQAPNGTEENPTIINDDIEGTIKMDDNKEGFLYTT